jgi:hypothetical protein
MYIYILAILLSITLPSWARVERPDRCTALFVTPKSNHELAQAIAFSSQLLFRAEPNKEPAQRAVEALIARNAISREYVDRLLRESPDLNSVYERILLDHYRSFQALFDTRAKLLSLQNAALLRELSIRGAVIQPKLSGYENLQLLSRSNLDRYSRLNSIDDEYLQDPQIAAAVNNLRFDYLHNTTQNEFYGGYMLSSRQLVRYGLPGGRNSRKEFNREYMQSDDNIYFFLNVSSKSSPVGSQQSIYGSRRVSVSESYASKFAWVSPFVMFEYDLGHFGEDFKLPGYIYSAAVSMSDTEKAYLRSSLHNYDFTLTDFQTLVRRYLGTFLYRSKHGGTSLSRSSAPSFEDLIALLYSSDPQVTNQFIREYILNPLHIGKLELKVPVAIPSRYRYVVE